MSLTFQISWSCDNLIYYIFRLKYSDLYICIINDCPKPISFIPYIAYPISHTVYRIPYIVYPKNIKISKFSKISKNVQNLIFFLNFKKFQNLENLKNFIKFLNFSIFFQILNFFFKICIKFQN
jgi:hypothetical protein